MSFKYPEFLFLFLTLPALIFYYLYALKKYRSGIAFPSTKILAVVSHHGLPSSIRHILFCLRLLAISLLIIASSRPVGNMAMIEKEVEVIDIMLLLDVSRSMNIIDIEGTSRFVTAKTVIREFVGKIKKDRVGLIAFAGESYTLVPLTTDYSIFSSFLNNLEIGDLEDGTAIGMALACGCERLKSSEAKNRVMILLTDGENTAGSISPESGTMMAKELGIRVYTIGIGTTGEVILRERSTDSLTGRTFFQDRKVTSRLNPELLKKIALETGGVDYRVFTGKELADVYSEIGKLERTKIKFRTIEANVEYYRHFVLTGLILLILIIFVQNLLFRTIP